MKQWLNKQPLHYYLITLVTIRTLFFGASIGESLIILGFTALIGYNKHLEEQKIIKQLELDKANLSNKVQADLDEIKSNLSGMNLKGLRKEVPKDIRFF